jgi:hypothetical protein
MHPAPFWSNRLAIRLISAAVALATAMPALAYEGEVQGLCTELAGKIAVSGRSTIGVADFTDISGNATELGRFLAEEVAIELGNSGKGFRIIDRNHLATLLKEHKLSASGLIDPQTARKLGQIAGIDVIITGFLTPFGDAVHVTVKALETDTATMIASAKGSIPKSATIEALLSRGIADGTGGGEAASGQPAKSAPQQREAVVVQEVIYELQGCTLSSQTIVCELLIQNNSKNRTLRIYGSTALYDDHGNEYLPSALDIANNHHELRYYSDPGNFLPYGITVRAELTFTGIRPEATKVAMMILLCDADHTGWQQVEFRDIDLDQPQTPRIGSPSAGQGQSQGVAGEVAGEVRDTVTETAKGVLKKWKKRILE